MSQAPDPVVISAIEAGTVTITRRVEVYEADGETLWNPDVENDPDFKRLVDGSISVDYTRDERRTLDLTLRNDDKLLRPNALGGFWYDKVIKIFRGVIYTVADTPPAIAIVEHIDGAAASYQFRSQLNAMGYTRTDSRLDITSVTDLADYDIAISYTRSTRTAKAQLLNDFYASGKNVVTISTANYEPDLPFVLTSTATPTPISWGITPLTTDNPLIGVFTAETAAGTATGRVIGGLDTTAQRVAQYTGNGYTNHITASVASNSSAGKWFDLHLPNYTGVQATKLLKAGIGWTHDYNATASWEIQQGEFVIDNINDQNFPYQVKVTGRDYTKKCLTSKFENAVTFEAGTLLRELIVAIASNAGITKFKLPPLTEALGTAISADRGTERWAVMKDAANANNYEIFFDNQGYLVMRKFLDPAFSPTTATFKTGPDGNMVSYERSVNDSRLYNHIVVVGDPADGDETRLPYFGEAKNTEPSSPTHIRQPGDVTGLEDRLYTFASTFFTSDQQCQDLALSLLKIHALESYELSVGSIYYPWLEAGEIVDILDPDRLPIDPTRFLMDTITYPLGLGPMSITAKRVTFVADPNSSNVPTDDDEAA